jgi:putative endonuclease
VKKGYVYILTNQTGSVLYIGVTSDIIKRIYEHKEKLVEGFSKKYSLDKLVYYECFDDIQNAIAREKQLKGGNRKKKLDIVNSMNPKWDDLYDKILD